MPNYDYDVITVGGGLGGAALAKVLATKGLRVLVTERERQFKDRIRGEVMWPWGVAEARTLGLYDRLLESCAHELPFVDLSGFPLRDLRTTTPQKLPSLTFYHPAMQEIVLASASSAGAEVRRGAVPHEVKPGYPPVATIEEGNSRRELTARMIVCADGKSSMGRTWGGFSAKRGKQRLFGAGLMFEDMRVADDTGVFLINPELRQIAYLFPEGSGRVRAYLVYALENVARIQGETDVPRFIAESIRVGIPEQHFAGARALAPLASFDMTEHWVDHPYRDGFALIGDAAGATDPTWGQGLSLTLRDVRVLADSLLGSDDWDAAGHAYASARDAYFDASMKTGGWQFDLFFDVGPEAEARRARALPLLAREPDRYPDHAVSGPELPSDDRVRRHFFGEE
jgi:2-polyprenyl-6-methoxyphenol hydroxylase-like FAD-dependent oxidoreductase